MQTIVLLTISNIFMTIAWYGHLKYKESPLWITDEIRGRESVPADYRILRRCAGTELVSGLSLRHMPSVIASDMTLLMSSATISAGMAGD